MKEEAPSRKIVLEVCDPETRKQLGGVKIYYVYTIKGQDSKGQFDIKRRYSDFDSLRSTLLKRWPGVYIPSLPSKIKTKYTEQQFIQIRMQYLTMFMNALAEKQYIWLEEDVQFFIKNDTMSLDKVLSSFSKLDSQQLLYRYQNSFKHLIEREEGQVAAKDIISEFQKTVKKLFGKAQKLKDKAEEVINVQEKYNARYVKNFFPVLERYERKCISKYIQSSEDEEKTMKIISQEQLTPKKEQFEEVLKQCSMKTLFEQLKRQKRQILAFEKVLIYRDQFVKQTEKMKSRIKSHEVKISQLIGGKKSLKDKIMNVSKDAGIKDHQQSLTKSKDLAETNEKLCKIIDLVLVEDIKQFQEERKRSYYLMVKEIMKEELKHLEKQKNLWKELESFDHNQHYFQIQSPQKNKIFYSPTKQVDKVQENDQVDGSNFVLFEKQDQGKIIGKKIFNKTSDLYQKEQEKNQTEEKQQRTDEHEDKKKHEEKVNKEKNEEQIFEEHLQKESKEIQQKKFNKNDDKEEQQKQQMEDRKEQNLEEQKKEEGEAKIKQKQKQNEIDDDDYI